MIHRRFRRLLPLLIFSSGFGCSSGVGQTIAAPGAPGAAFEWQVDSAGAGRSALAEGTRSLGDIRHYYGSVTGTTTVTIDADASLILGGTWRRFEFSGSLADVPSSLTMLALKLGYTRTFSPQWTFRAEIDPGLYSDFEDLGSSDVNAPLGLRLLYARSRDLQWGFAFFVDPRSSVPVIGGVGVRWRFAPRYTLLAFLPSPRVEYAVSDALAVSVGASMRGGTFRVAEDFGRRRGRPSLDDQNLDFRELTVSVGAHWQIQPRLRVNAGMGWMIDRRFEFEQRDLLFNGDGAPHVSLSVSGTF